MTRRRVLLLVLVFAMAARLANLSVMLRLPVAEYQRTWGEGDMATAWEWSGRIVAGDRLGRDTPHQYTSWMQEIAPRETWERWWGGRGVFHQAPLYAYVLAAMRWVVGDGIWAIGLCHLGLGLVNVCLITLLADRMFGRLAALVAGLGAALYGPFMLFETFLLRDTLAVTTALLLLVMLTGADGARRWHWFAAGAFFALAVLARETTLLFAPFVVLWVVQRFGPRPAVCATVLPSFVVGALVVFLPLVARNLVVGVVPWALSTRGVEAFIAGHAAGGSPFGYALPPAFRSVLEASGGRLGPAIRLTLATYDGHWGQLLAHEVAKLGAVVSRYEAMDNVNWYYFADRSPMLAWSLRWNLVLAFGLVGLWTSERRGDDRILAYFLLATLAGLMYATVIGRFRLVPAAVLLVYAGGAVAWMVRQVGARHWGAAACAGAAVVALIGLSAGVLAGVESRQRYRAAEFFMAAKYEYEHAERGAALDELRAGLATAYRGPEQRTVPVDYVQLLQPLVVVAYELGRDAEARAELERLAHDYPADPTLRGMLAGPGK